MKFLSLVERNTGRSRSFVMNDVDTNKIGLIVAASKWARGGHQVLILSFRPIIVTRTN